MSVAAPPPTRSTGLRAWLPAMAAWMLVILFLAVAAVSLVGRVAVSQLAGSEQRIADEIGRQLGLEVAIGRLDGRFQVLHPVVDLHGLSVRPVGADVAVRVGRIQLEIDVPRSLLRMALVPAALVIDDLDMALERTAEGQIRLRGGVVAADIPLSAVAEFFRTAGYVQIENSELALHRAGAGGPDRLALDGVLQYRRGEGRGVLELAYRADGIPLPALGRLHYRLRDKPLSGTIPRGRIELAMTDLALTQGLSEWWPGGPEFDGELESLQVIGDLHPDSGVQVDIEARAPRLRVGASPMLENVELTLGAVGLGAATGSLKLGRSGGQVEGVPLNLEGLEVRWRDLEGSPQVLLSSPGFASAPLLRVLLSTPGLPEMVERWLAGLGPRGTVRDARLLLEPASGRFALATRLQELHLDGYRGAPAISDADLDLVLFEQGGWIDLDSGAFGLHFPDVFPTGWNYERGRGRVELAFDKGGVAVSGADIEIFGDGVHAHGAFALHLPQEEAERSISLMIGIERAEAGRTADFLPARMPPALRGWLVEAVRRGSVEEGGVVISGLLLPHLRGPLRPELFFDIAGGHVAFDPRWPVAEDVGGRLLVERYAFTGQLHSGRLGGLELTDVELQLPMPEGGLAALEIRGGGRAAAADGLEFLAAMPVDTGLLSGLAAWRAEGELGLNYELAVPLDGSAVEHAAVGVALDLEHLYVAEVALSAQRVRGRIEYRHPGQLLSRDLAGELFSGPVEVQLEGALEPGEDGLRIGLTGEADASELAVWTTVDTLVGAEGVFDYDIDITLALSGAVGLTLTSTADDLRTGLPEPVDRGDGPLALRLAAAPDEDWTMAYTWGSHGGSFRLRDREFVSGTIGFGVEPPELPDAGLQARGRIERIDLGAWSNALAAIEDAAVARGRPRTRRRTAADLDVVLEFTETAWGGRELGPASLQVGGSTLATELAIVSESAAGRMLARIDEPLELELDHLRWPPAASGDATAFPAGDIDPAAFISMNVHIDALEWHGASVGALAFELRPANEILVIEGIRGDLRGLELGPDEEGRSRLEWRFGARPQSRYQGRIFGSQSSGVLEGWGLAPTLDSESFAFDLDLAWPGSPMHLSARELDGRVRIEVGRGRFVQVEAGTGPLRLIGLFNFATIARRMRLDFTDVYQRGMAFDDINGVLDFDSGRVRSARPLSIRGPGSSFRIGAELDLVSQALEGDIVVTLPVSRNLPWYAAYAILLANPITGAGVLVAERVFRDQIDRFSSARYRLRGSLDQPEVDFVSIFADEVDLPVRMPPEDDPNLEWLLDDPFLWPDEFPLTLPLEENDS
ncbi:MAG: hypothetical protein EA417_07705 [Gammaproteobacteria bacterium]|nr:MAG: hypothetical protein EA417_07705 [Gammaproteobacteria bacterium]